jgi:arylsulfatase A
VLESAPPAPLVEGGNRLKNRPVYPDWKNIVNPND